MATCSFLNEPCDHFLIFVPIAITLRNINLLWFVYPFSGMHGTYASKAEAVGLYIALLLLKFIPPYALKIENPFKRLSDFHITSYKVL